LPDAPGPKPAIRIDDLKFTETKNLFDLLPVPNLKTRPVPFEDLKQAYGFVLYRTTLSGGSTGKLQIKELRDYGLVFVNGKRVGVLDRRLDQNSLDITLPSGKVVLDILVENLGRINFGPELLKNKKGITENVAFNNKELYHWQMYSLPFNNTNKIKWVNANHHDISAPVIKRGIFNLEKLGDTYFDMSNWGKGVVWINGHNLGRYWNIGPQQTLYLPVEWLKKGKNEVIVLELLNPGQSILKGIDKAILDKLQ
jgi:beta-galactosidase